MLESASFPGRGARRLRCRGAPSASTSECGHSGGTRVDLTPKRFADTVVLRPAGRIDHTSSDDFKAALAPFLERCAAGQDHVVLDLVRARVHQQRGAARAHAGAPSRPRRRAAGSWSPASRPRREGDLRDQQVHPGLRRVPRRARGAGARVARGAGRVRGAAEPRARCSFASGARAARIPGRAHDARTSSRSWWPRSSRRPAAASTRRTRLGPSSTRELDFPVSPHLRRQLVVRADRDGRRRVRPVRPRQRRARVRQPRAGDAAGRRGHRFHVFMSHLHWDHIMGFPFFMPAYIPGNERHASTAATPMLEEAFRRQHARAVVSRWTSRGSARASSSCTSSRAAPYEIAGLTRAGQAAAPLGRLLRLSLRARRQGRRVLDRLRAQARRPRRRPERSSSSSADADLVIFDAHVLAGRRDLGEGGLGPLEQRRRRRAVPARARQAPLPVPPRARSSTTTKIVAVLRDTRRLEEITRAGHPPRDLRGLRRHGDRPVSAVA